MKIEEIELNKIKENPENIRVEKEDLSELMSSIKQKGLLQPIGIHKDNGTYTIIFGHRRFNAVKKLGADTINAIVYSGLQQKDILIMNTIENVQQKTITPLELGRVVQRLLKLDLTFNEISERLSISVSRIRTAHNLLEWLPKKQQDKINYNTSMTGNKRRGSIGISSLNTVSRLARNYKLKRNDVNRLINVAEKTKLSNSQINLIPDILKSENITMDKAFAKASKYVVTKVFFYIEGSEYEKVKRLYNPKNPSDAGVMILNGKVKTVDKSKYFVKATGGL